MYSKTLIYNIHQLCVVSRGGAAINSQRGMSHIKSVSAPSDTPLVLCH